MKLKLMYKDNNNFEHIQCVEKETVVLGSERINPQILPTAATNETYKDIFSSNNASCNSSDDGYSSVKTVQCKKDSDIVSKSISSLYIAKFKKLRRKFKRDIKINQFRSKLKYDITANSRHGYNGCHGSQIGKSVSDLRDKENSKNNIKGQGNGKRYININGSGVFDFCDDDTMNDADVEDEGNVVDFHNKIGEQTPDLKMAKKRKIKRSGIAASSPPRKQICVLKTPEMMIKLEEEDDDEEVAQSPQKRGRNSFLSVAIKRDYQICDMGRQFAKGVHCLAYLTANDDIDHIKKLNKSWKRISFDIPDKKSSKSKELKVVQNSKVVRDNSIESNDFTSQRNIFETFDTDAYKENNKLAEPEVTIVNREIVNQSITNLDKVLKSAILNGVIINSDCDKSQELTSLDTIQEKDDNERSSIGLGSVSQIQDKRDIDKDLDKESVSSDNTDSIKGLSDLTVCTDGLFAEVMSDNSIAEYPKSKEHVTSKGIAGNVSKQSNDNETYIHNNIQVDAVISPVESFSSDLKVHQKSAPTMDISYVTSLYQTNLDMLNNKENEILDSDDSSINLDLEVCPYKKGGPAVIDLYTYGHGLFQVPSKLELTGTPSKFRKKSKDKIRNWNFKEYVFDNKIENKDDAHCYPTPKSSPGNTEEEPTWDFEEYEFEKPIQNSSHISVITEPVEGGNLIEYIHLNDEFETSESKLSNQDDSGNITSINKPKDLMTSEQEDHSENIVIDHSKEKVKNTSSEVSLPENIITSEGSSHEYITTPTNTSNDEMLEKVTDQEALETTSIKNEVKESNNVEDSQCNKFNRTVLPKTLMNKENFKILGSVTPIEKETKSTTTGNIKMEGLIDNKMVISVVKRRRKSKKKTVASKISAKTGNLKQDDLKTKIIKPPKRRPGRPAKSKNKAKCATTRKSSRITKKKDDKKAKNDDKDSVKPNEEYTPSKNENSGPTKATNLSDSPGSLLALAQVASDHLSRLHDDQEVENNISVDAKIDTTVETDPNACAKVLHLNAIGKVLPSPILSTVPTVTNSQPQTHAESAKEIVSNKPTLPRISFNLDEHGTINQTSTASTDSSTGSSAVYGLPSGLLAQPVLSSGDKLNKEKKMDIAAKFGEALSPTNEPSNSAPNVRKLLTENTGDWKLDHTKQSNSYYQNAPAAKRERKSLKPKNKRTHYSVPQDGPIPFSNNSINQTGNANMFYSSMSSLQMASEVLTPENQRLLQTIENNRARLQLPVTCHPLNFPPGISPPMNLSHVSNNVLHPLHQPPFMRGPMPHTGVQVYRYPAVAIQPQSYPGPSIQFIQNPSNPNVTHPGPIVFPSAQQISPIPQYENLGEKPALFMDSKQSQIAKIPSTTSVIPTSCETNYVNSHEEQTVNLNPMDANFIKSDEIKGEEAKIIKDNENIEQSIAISSTDIPKVVKEPEIVVKDESDKVNIISNNIVETDHVMEDSVIVPVSKENTHMSQSSDVDKQDALQDIESKCENISEQLLMSTSTEVKQEEDIKSEDDKKGISLVISEVVGAVDSIKPDSEQLPVKRKKHKRKMQDIRDIHRNSNTPPKKAKLECEVSFEANKSGLELLSDAAELPRVRENTSPDTTTTTPQDNEKVQHPFQFAKVSSSECMNDSKSDIIYSDQNKDNVPRHRRSSLEHHTSLKISSTWPRNVKRQNSSELKDMPFISLKDAKNTISSTVKEDKGVKKKNLIKRSDFEKMNIKDLGSYSKEELFKELERRNSVTPCICGTGFIDSAMYMLHRASHNTDEPHMCALCGKTGHSWMDFFVHLYDHSK